jgi:hypothetical protein
MSEEQLPAAVERVPQQRPSGSKTAFWVAILIGAALRAYCVISTNGTGDMDDWQDHAQQAHARGLIGYYHANAFANHPPLISEVSAFIWQLSVLTHIPFRILFRAPFALLDAGNMLLLFSLLPRNRWRYFTAAWYWLSPAAIIISAFHGNTDTAVPFFILLSVWLITKQRTVSAGAATGAGFWVKLPGVLAVPALLLLFRSWRTRAIFLLAAALTALGAYLPALIQDYKIVCTNVFGYRGLILQTADGTPLWGPSVLLFSTLLPIQAWPEAVLRPVLFLLEQSSSIAIAAILILVWMRKDRHSPIEVCVTIGMAYTILFGFSDYWAFQYFAWGLPFWFFLRWWFSIPAVTLTSLYLYSLHSLFCGNPWLLGAWNFSGHATLPSYVLLVRDVSVGFFFLAALLFLIRAIQNRLALSDAPITESLEA